MIMQLKLDRYKGVPREKASIKFKRSMKLLLKDMVRLKETLGPKRGLTAWVLFVSEIVSKARETSQHTLKIKFNKTDKV